jgi:hypothetical protein
MFTVIGRSPVFLHRFLPDYVGTDGDYWEGACTAFLRPHNDDAIARFPEGDLAARSPAPLTRANHASDCDRR